MAGIQSRSLYMSDTPHPFSLVAAPLTSGEKNNDGQRKQKIIRMYRIITGTVFFCVRDISTICELIPGAFFVGYRLWNHIYRNGALKSRMVLLY